MTVKHLFALSLGFGAVFFLSQQSHSQEQPQNCAPHADVLDHLANSFSESRRAIGLNSNNTVMELFASESGSWTIIITLPSGMTCLAAAGEGFESISNEGLPQVGEQV